MEDNILKSNIIVIHINDNVCVVTKSIKKGEPIVLPNGESFPAQSDIPYGHKAACREIHHGSDIIKYGEAIGQAKGQIIKGEWVHTHNILIEE
jgi:altronate hydrolase